MDISSLAQLKQQLKQLIVADLVLEDVTSDEIDSDAPLFGEGLGLDSIDAIELALAIQKRYAVKITADDEKNRHIFASVSSLARYIQQQLAEPGNSVDESQRDI